MLSHGHDAYAPLRCTCLLLRYPPLLSFRHVSSPPPLPPSQIRFMDLEARSLPAGQKASLLAKLREYKADLQALRRSAAVAATSAAPAASAGAGGVGDAGEESAEETARKQLLGSSSGVAGEVRAGGGRGTARPLEATHWKSRVGCQGLGGGSREVLAEIPLHLSVRGCAPSAISTHVIGECWQWRNNSARGGA